MSLDFFRRLVGGGRRGNTESGADDADRKPHGAERESSPAALSPEEQRKLVEAGNRIADFVQRAEELIQSIARGRVQDVPALREQFARVRGIHDQAEDLYAGVRADAVAHPSFAMARTGIHALRRYAQALDRAQAAHEAYELYPKVEYRDTGGEGRADFDTHVSRVEERRSRDHIAGSKPLREVMGV